MRTSINGEKLLRVLCLALLFIALTTLLVQVLAPALVGAVWDDAYISVRYAHNVLSYGTFSWNGTSPTWGFTSALDIIFLLPFAAITNNPTAVAVLGSVTAMILFLLSIPFLIASVLSEADKRLRNLCIVVAYALLALAANPLGLLAASGMDTTLTLAFISLYTALMFRTARSLGEISRAEIFWMGILGALAFLVRPDLMLFTTVMPLCLALWSETKKERMRASRMLAITIVALAVILSCAWVYFGSPVPLPFYGKAGLLYGATIRKRFLFESVLLLIAYVDAYKFLFLALLALIIADFKYLFRCGEHAIVIGMLVSSAAFVCYYLFFVIQIMGGDSRFYYPTVPALLVVAVIVIAYGLRSIQERSGELMRAWAASVLCAIFLAALYTPFLSGLQQLGYVFARERPYVGTVWHGDIVSLYRIASGDEYEWPCLDMWAALPNNASLATTEMGMASIISPEKFTLDLAGLNSTEIALQQTTLPQAIIEHNIDLVYLPWRASYPEMRDAILSSPQFQEDYEVFSASDLNSEDDVAVRKDSPYAPQLIACLQNVIAQRKAAAIASAGPVSEPNGFSYYITLPYPLMMAGESAPLQ